MPTFVVPIGRNLTTFLPLQVRLFTQSEKYVNNVGWWIALNLGTDIYCFSDKSSKLNWPNEKKKKLFWCGSRFSWTILFVLGVKIDVGATLPVHKTFYKNTIRQMKCLLLFYLFFLNLQRITVRKVYSNSFPRTETCFACTALVNLYFFDITSTSVVHRASFRWSYQSRVDSTSFNSAFTVFLCVFFEEQRAS